MILWENEMQTNIEDYADTVWTPAQWAIRIVMLAVSVGTIVGVALVIGGVIQ